MAITSWGKKITIASAAALICAAQASAQTRIASDLTTAIRKTLQNHDDEANGVALEYFEEAKYRHLIVVEYTGYEFQNVEMQIIVTAQVAQRIGQLVLDQGFKAPGKYLDIKMALKTERHGYTNTFSVRYNWTDVLAVTRAHSTIGELAAKGKIVRIWREYWPTMCLNRPPSELFAEGSGDAWLPEEVENPQRKDLTCHRKLHDD